MESHNVRMRQTRVDIDFAEKALEGFRIAIGGARQGPQDFELACCQDADLVSNSRFGLVDNPKELVVANGLTGLGHYLGHIQVRFYGRGRWSVNYPLLARRAPNQS